MQIFLTYCPSPPIISGWETLVYILFALAKLCDFDRKKAFDAATIFAANIYAPNSAKVDSFYTYVHAPYETYRIECSNGGNLIECTSEDVTCPMCNSNS